jgi:hypothetical protein
MTFDVVSCGFSPARLSAHPGHASVRELPSPTMPGFLEQGYDLLTTAAVEHPERPVLLVHAASPAARRRVATLRATVRTPTMAVGFARPVTGLAAVVTWLASLAARDVPVGVATGHTLERHVSLLPTYVVTSSVARVDHPVVRLNHHLLSWLPGTVFTIALDDHPRITTGRMTSDRPASSPERPASSDLVVAGSSRLAERLDGVTPAAVVERCEAGGGTAEAPSWGRARFFEQTVVPRDVGASLAEIATLSTMRCPDCGEHALGTTCPFCSAREGVPA